MIDNKQEKTVAELRKDLEKLAKEQNYQEYYKVLDKIEEIEEQQEKAKEAEAKRLAEIEYNKKVKKLYEWTKTLKPVPRAYIEALHEKDYISFQHKLAHQTAFSYMEKPELVSEIDTKEKVVKIMDDAIEADRLSWCTGPTDDGNSGLAEATGINCKNDILEIMEKKLKEFSKIKAK